MPSVEIDGFRVSCIDVGLGLPVVLLPGLTGAKEWFEYQFLGLGKSYRVLSYDLRPVGRQGYSVELLAEDLAKFLSAMRIPSAVIGGHSFGGLVAQQFALSYPQRTRSLILASTFPHLPEEAHHSLYEWLTPGEVELESPFLARLPRIFRGRKREKTAEQAGLEFLASHTAGLTRAALNERLRMIREFDVRDRLGDLNMPVLIVVGAKDEPAILQGSQLLYEGLSDATLEVIEGAGHFCFFERHDLFNNVVDYFLAERLVSLS